MGASTCDHAFGIRAGFVNVSNARAARAGRQVRWSAVCAVLGAVMAVPAHLAGEESVSPGPDRFIEAVQVFADQVLEHGRDRYGEAHTPLFVDRLEVRNLAAADKRSNFATQQNLMRTLVGLTALTGEDRYRDAAEQAAAHMFAHHRSPSGLLHWGGYVYIDLESGEYRGPRNDEHSLRGHIPFYEFLYEVDPEATTQFMRAFWNSHVLDWGTLMFCRRGGTRANWDVPMGRLWDHEYEDPGPFIRTRRTLAFIHSGTDMIYAAAMLDLLADEREAWTWGERLARKYVEARHPETGLGVVQYNVLEAIRSLPDGDGPLPTVTHYGDRAKNQFASTGSSDPQDEDYNPLKGKIAADGEPVAREPWSLFRGSPRSIYQTNALVQLHVGEQLGERGQPLVTWTVNGLKAYAEHAYDVEDDRFRPMWADGTDLTNLRLPRTGYFGRKGELFTVSVEHAAMLLSYARAWRLSGDEQLWPTVRALAKGRGLGDFGREPGGAAGMNLKTDHDDPRTLLALLELADGAADREAYLALAERIGDNILEQRVRNGLFVSSPEECLAMVDAIEPLALLAVAAARLDRGDQMPAILPLRGAVLLGR